MPRLQRARSEQWGPRVDLCDQRGVATVELALLLPTLAVLLVGMVSSGFLLIRQFSLESAVRDAARSAAVLPYDEPPPGMTWVEAVQDITRTRAQGDIGSEAVCVALVDAVTKQPVRPSLTSDPDGGACFDESSSEGLRVQVVVRVPDRLEGAFFTQDVVLSARGSARYELPRPL